MLFLGSSPQCAARPDVQTEELALMAQAHKDWYYAMMSYIMGDDSDAEEESK